MNLSLHSYQPQAHGEMEGYLSAAASYARKAAERGKHTVFRLWTLDPSRETNGTCRRLLDLLSREFPLCRRPFGPFRGAFPDPGATHLPQL